MISAVGVGNDPPDHPSRPLDTSEDEMGRVDFKGGVICHSDAHVVALQKRALPSTMDTGHSGSRFDQPAGHLLRAMIARYVTRIAG